jgi:hypothetical protein
MSRHLSNLGSWLTLAFCAAILSFAFGILAMSAPGGAWVLILVAASMLCSLLWLAAFVASLFFVRWRALWLLAAAPIALFPPYAVGTILYSCAHGACL